jgi:Cupredoxin-like domain
MALSRFRLTDSKIVAFAIIGVIAVFGILIFFVGEGGVRHVQITFKEVIQTTVAFRNIDGETKVVGITGNTQVNPALVSRTGADTAYVLTVINQDNDLHMLYIDDLNLHTKILRSGENDTITIYPKREGVYEYYDRLAMDIEKGTTAASIYPLGQFKIVKVAGDEWS